MKKLLLVLFIGLSSLAVNAQQDVETILTSGKWFIESVQEQGQQPEMSDNKNDEWIVYHKDGNAEESTFEVLSKSNWSFDKANKTIKLTGAETIFYKIIEISEEKLIVEQKETVDASEGLMITYVK
ncbi:lipocalin family protein [Tenacibaculum sp. IB213877]|uniref:lipocalin family protein n=1 Tax=Tenacibaculum sp. IB213877 TaxID=3097351 RepID=UPI002A5A7624|nr:lipocalin family protein [Tenacibaculum sp. IB213877]MDY0779646.1 lipocalin family protein [Tenacibaculum sp. IB213877]